MMAQGESGNHSKIAKAYSVFVRLALPPYTIHFNAPSYLQPQTLDLLDKKVCKETLKSTARDSSVREAIGSDARYWADLVTLLRAAVPSLERRSFTIWDPTSVDYESTSGALIAGNYPGLWRDLERLNDLVSISRNVLTIGAVAQDLAAEKGVDYEIFRLINCCVRVAARGYDGDAGTGEEEKWQWVVNAYKKLLITTLQVLNNLVAQNEKRKLMLWASLFDSPNTVDTHRDESDRQSAPDDNTTSRPQPPLCHNDLLLAYGTDGTSNLPSTELDNAASIDGAAGFVPFPFEAEAGKARLSPNAYVYWAKRMRETCIADFRFIHHRSPTTSEIFLNMPRYWQSGSEFLESQQTAYDDAMRKFREDVAVWDTQQRETKAASTSLITDARNGDDPFHYQVRQVEQKLKYLETQLAEHHLSDTIPTTLDTRSNSRTDITNFDSPNITRLMPGDDMRMLFTAEAGAKILESGKAELMKRLEGYDNSAIEHDSVLPPSRNPDGVNTRPVRTIAGQPVEKTRSMSRSPPGYRGERDELRVAGRKMPDPVARWRRASEDEDALLEDSLEGEDEDEIEEGEDDEDYPGSTEDGRGLLTDVPLILGPSEIEVLPMLIMSGLVPRLKPGEDRAVHKGLSGDENSSSNTATLLTHLLLSQTSGRNLLRELLIFVAAWDLREEELYFKFMVKIMEAILKNGLMPYAYHAFRDRSRSKDIISPAQAVIMKLLTCIFRGRFESAKSAGAVISNQRNAKSEHAPALHSPQSALQAPEKVDLHVLNFIFTEFRQHIIPQTCALIFLQGQIHRGRASPEDFPLNLWDMERMYEGVYQYLEFFAVLTEDQTTYISKTTTDDDPGTRSRSLTDGENFSWKKILADWEMASELVTLLRELENGIPKSSTRQMLTPQVQPPLQQADGRVESSHRSQSASGMQRSLSFDNAVSGQLDASSNNVTIERPFEVESQALRELPPISSHTSRPLSTNQQQGFDLEASLGYPDDVAHGTVGTSLPSLSANNLQHEQDEPSDFEWRNLKKLTVLVLSSLVWKNAAVQEQVRKCGGLEALVSCCKPDEHNPYIREHSIMCLRFAVEGNEENSNIIRNMATRQRQARIRNSTQSTPKTGNLPVENVHGNASVVEDVPREVLDTNGYETFMDGKGQVGLRRKDQPGSKIKGSTIAVANSSFSSTSKAPAGDPPLPPPPSAPSSHAAAASSALSALQRDLGILSATTGASLSGKGRNDVSATAQLTKMTAEKAAELMQSALRDLPMGDKLVSDRQKAEALARLDRAFESTEQALGQERKDNSRKP